jgi:hypothetical protein
MNVFVAHLVGDFILQNEWMALNKKHNSFACLVHVCAYLLPFLFCQLTWWQIALIGIQHFAQDRSAFILWWVRTVKRVPKEYWGQIPLYVDQAFHCLWIAIVILLVRL